jgi:hypothetical protein
VKVQLYSNAACDPSGAGEGANFLGTFPVTLTSGSGTLSATVPALAAGTSVSGTMTIGNPTQGDLETSEFSACNISGTVDLGVTGTASPTPVDPGHQLNLVFHVTNSGPDPASVPALSLTYPSNATFFSIATTSGSCTGVRGHATCTLGTIPDGGSATITVILFPTIPGPVSASATITAAQTDPVSSNNTATVPFTVTTAPFTPASYVVNSTGDGGDSA